MDDNKQNDYEAWGEALQYPELSAQNYVIASNELARFAYEMEPCEMGYFDMSYLWADDERKVWLNKEAVIYNEREIVDEIVRGSTVQFVARAIYFTMNELSVFAVDASHYDAVGDSQRKGAIARNGSIESEILRPLSIPVVALAQNHEEFEVLEKQLTGFNISFADSISLHRLLHP